MSHFTCREWGHVKLGEGGFTSKQADALHTSACQHPLAHKDATNILVYRRDRIVVRQMVGMLAADGCSLEILPKVDHETADSETVDSVRRRLIRMLDVALGLNLNLGQSAAIETQKYTLLEILIRAFADKLLAEVRRGLPQVYHQCEEDLPALRGRLNATRQFTHNALRPDRLSCRFDQLDANTPLMKIMAAAVVYLGNHARFHETRRKLDELRHALIDIPIVPVQRLPWKQVRIDRTNQRWESLFHLVKLLLRREWQATHHSTNAPQGLTLLFPMNDLFEKYVAAMLRKALAGSGIQVVDQGGHRACLGAFTGEHLEKGDVFRTKPDLLLRRGKHVAAIIDTKWKKLGADPLDRKHGVSQADVYQLMAYARLYSTNQLMLLYPESPGSTCGERAAFGIAGGSEKLSVSTLDMALDENDLLNKLEMMAQTLVSSSNAEA